ncbi:KAP family P-loop NTPase fold protein [Brachybacterium alimentarium]|uniref:KAP family P-loop NTPase fold protein n=1 Tax=Brachybacterium alimentarium TaxID=47845 RepID=UPI003FD39AFB
MIVKASGDIGGGHIVPGNVVWEGCRHAGCSPGGHPVAMDDGVDEGMRVRGRKVLNAADAGLGRPVEGLHLEDAAQYRALARYIVERPTPCTIAVHGEWGIGKTHTLQEIEANIRARTLHGRKDRVAGSYYFDAWKYATYTESSELGLALAVQIDDHFGGALSRWSRWQWRRSLRWLAASASAGVDGYTSLIPTENINPAIIGARVALNAASSVGDQRDLTRTLRAEDRVKKGLKKGVSRFISQQVGADRIVVFVDNLDRIDPQQALRLLQTVCNLLDFEQLVVVAAVDLGVIRNHLRGESQDGDRASAFRERFLDKMINLEYRVPSLGYSFSDVLQTQVKGYLSQGPGPVSGGGAAKVLGDPAQRRSAQGAPEPVGVSASGSAQASGTVSSYALALERCMLSIARLGEGADKEKPSRAQKHLTALISGVGGVNPRSMDKILQALVLTEMIGLELEGYGDGWCSSAGGDTVAPSKGDGDPDLAWLRLGAVILQVYRPIEYERLYKAVESGSIRDENTDDGAAVGSSRPDSEGALDGGTAQSGFGVGAVLDDDEVTGAFEGLLSVYADSGDTIDVLTEVLGQVTVETAGATDRSEATNRTTSTGRRDSGGSAGGEPAAGSRAESMASEGSSSGLEGGAADEAATWVDEIVARMEENLSDQFAQAPDLLRRCTTPRGRPEDRFLPQYGLHLNGKNVSLYRRSENEVSDRVARLRPKLGEISYTNSAATLRFGRAGKQKDINWTVFWKAVERRVTDEREYLIASFDEPEGARRDESGSWLPLVFRVRPTGLPFAIDVDLSRSSDSERNELVLERYAEVARAAFHEAYLAWGDEDGGEQELKN